MFEQLVPETTDVAVAVPTFEQRRADADRFCALIEQPPVTEPEPEVGPAVSVPVRQLQAGSAGGGGAGAGRAARAAGAG